MHLAWKHHRNSTYQPTMADLEGLGEGDGQKP